MPSASALDTETGNTSRAGLERLAAIAVAPALVDADDARCRPCLCLANMRAFTAA